MSKQKQKYRIRNWRAYNAALVERGSLTVWFDDTHQTQWYETVQSGRRGAPRRYSDVAVQCGLVMREVFHLPLRALEGFMQSVITLLGQGCSTLESLVGEEPVEVEGIVVEAQADITDAIKTQQVEGKAT